MKKALVITAILVLVVLAGAIGGGAIKFGSGASGTGATGVSVVISRDFGDQVIEHTSSGSVPGGETVMRYLQRHYDVTTRYGGGFVQSIDGLAGSSRGGERTDWFYYVNGIEASEGAADRKLSEGDHVWWDYHNWGAAQRIPAVVGSWPEPFLTGEKGRQIPLALLCAGEQRACDEVRTRLLDEGVKGISGIGAGAGVGMKLLRIVVGPWEKIKNDPAVSLLAKGPGASGVYARPTAGGIELLDASGHVSRTLRQGGLVAATRFQEQQPTWVVTGTDDAGVASAAASLREDILQNKFAVALDQGRPVPLPVSSVP